MLKRKAKAVTGHGVHCSRCVSDQGDAPSRNRRQDFKACRVAELPGCRRRPSELLRKSRELRQGSLKPKSRPAREYGNANLLSCQRRDKYLAASRPMNFSHVRPWLQLKMAAKTESFLCDEARIKPSPFADLRILAIRSDKPPIGKFLLCSRHSLTINLLHSRAPVELHSRPGRVVEEMLVQLCPAHRKARSASEIRSRGMFLVHKTDSPEWKGAFWRQRDAQRFQGGDAPGQNALAAGLVDRGRPAIQNSNL